MAEHAYGAGYGYSMPVEYDDGLPSHTSFVIWLLVYVVIAVAILGGLKVGGFSFVFKTR